LAAQPGYRTGLMAKVISSAQLGRVDEARDALSRVLEIEPDLTIARWKAPALPFHPSSSTGMRKVCARLGCPKNDRLLRAP
jgi:hypothetical protein